MIAIGEAGGGYGQWGALMEPFIAAQRWDVKGDNDSSLVWKAGFADRRHIFQGLSSKGSHLDSP